MPAHRLYIASCGHLYDPQPDGSVLRIPVPMYVIRAASGRVYLVDTGNPRQLIGAPDGQPWYRGRCEISEADDPVARLAEMGLAPGDIDAIIATHFDFDHAGRYDVFGPLGTDVFVQRAHLAKVVCADGGNDPALWRIPGLRWRLVDGDSEIEPGLRVLRTDGHAVGHQSLAVETSSGWVILATDAIDSQAFLARRQFPSYADIEASNKSIDRLLALAEELSAPIIFGHDPEQWARLSLSPTEFAIR